MPNNDSHCAPTSDIYWLGRAAIIPSKAAVSNLSKSTLIPLIEFSKAELVRLEKKTATQLKWYYAPSVNQYALQGQTYLLTFTVNDYTLCGHMPGTIV